MSFFQSDVVRAEMVEISELQEEVYSNVFKFPSMPKEEQHRHVDILERLMMLLIALKDTHQFLKVIWGVTHHLKLW